MSPARSKRTAAPRRRSRAEIVLAACVAAGIVIVTALLVWLLRPGPAGTAGTGGYMNRQPRASAVVVVALLLGGAVTWFILRGSRRTKDKTKLLLPIALGLVLVVAIGAGVAWPGGLLRHGVAPPKPVATTTTLATTTTGEATTTTGATGASGATGAPSTTTTPSTGTATTTSP